jgi:methyltransferase
VITSINPAAAVIIALVAVERLGELRIANRHTRVLLAEGGIEIGGEHYYLIVALHAAWLAAIAVAVLAGAVISWPALILFACLQPVRFWVIRSLGKYWTTRIITVPGAKLIRRGPYRYVRHPNYLLVAAEIALLPLAFDAWGIALVFSALNAILLTWRIRVEAPALAAREPPAPEHVSIK